jgi:cell division protein FtsW (lipid II flippase)
MLEMTGVLKPSLHIFIKSLIFTGLGISLMLWLHYCDLRKVRPYTTYLYVSTMLLWFAVLRLGMAINGKQFLVLGPVNMDYISITPYILVISLAGIFTDGDWSNRRWTMKSLLLLVVPFLFCEMSNNTPLALMYTLVFIVLMAIAGARKIQIVGLSMVLIGLLLIKMYQNLGVSNLAFFQTASLWGQEGLGSETITTFHTDFAFRYFIQQFGWSAGLAIIFAGVTLVSTLVHAIVEIKDRFGRMAVGGLTTCFAVQMIWHVFMSLGFMPVVSMNLPFISFGGSQTILHLGAIGAILSIYKRKNLRSLPTDK